MTQEPITIIAFSMLFIPFTLVVGHFLRTRGDVFLRFVFGGESTAVSATNFLLNIGFYLLCLGLLLLNIGSPPLPEEPPPQLGATRRATAHSRPRRPTKSRAQRR